MKLNRNQRLAKIQEFDSVHLHILAMDYGIEMEGVMRNNNLSDTRYDFFAPAEGNCSYWPGTDKLHIHRNNSYKDRGLNYIYNKLLKQIKS